MVNVVLDIKYGLNYKFYLFSNKEMLEFQEVLFGRNIFIQYQQSIVK